MEYQQENSLFLRRMPLELRSQVYECYITAFIESWFSLHIPPQDPKQDMASSVDDCCPPLLQSCKMVAYELRPLMAQHSFAGDVRNVDAESGDIITPGMAISRHYGSDAALKSLDVKWGWKTILDTRIDNCQHHLTTASTIWECLPPYMRQVESLTLRAILSTHSEAHFMQNALGLLRDVGNLREFLGHFPRLTMFEVFGGFQPAWIEDFKNVFDIGQRCPQLYEGPVDSDELQFMILTVIRNNLDESWRWIN